MNKICKYFCSKCVIVTKRKNYLMYVRIVLLIPKIVISIVVLNSSRFCIECDVVWCDDCYPEKDNWHQCNGCRTTWCESCYRNTHNKKHCNGCNGMWCIECDKSNLNVSIIHNKCTLCRKHPYNN
jgi:hypothetical protein